MVADIWLSVMHGIEASKRDVDDERSPEPLDVEALARAAHLSATKPIRN